MNLSSLIVISLVLNLALGAVLMQRPPSPAPSVPVRAVAIIAPAMTSAPAVMFSAPVTEAFDWSQLAAADFKKYRDNLRTVGCPEPTVRDIITSEINSQFLTRRRVLLEDVQHRFWDMLARERELLGGDNEWKKPLEKLNEERKALLAEVLGDAPDQPETERQARFWQNFERQYAWLPVEKRAQIVALEMEFRTRQEALQKEISQRSDTKWTDADKARRKALADELDTARQRLLTQEELAEFKLRNSNAANWARNLNGFEASEAEWRAVATRRMEYDAALKKLDKKTAGEVRSRLENEWQAQLKATLGEERYAAYTLAQDSRYQPARRITQRFGLADSVATQAYEMQKTAQDMARQLREDKHLDPAARQAALAAIQQETQQSLEAALGPKVFSTYRKYNGDWLKKLNPPQEE